MHSPPLDEKPRGQAAVRGSGGGVSGREGGGKKGTARVKMRAIAEAKRWARSLGSTVRGTYECSYTGAGPGALRTGWPARHRPPAHPLNFPQ